MLAVAEDQGLKKRGGKVTVSNAEEARNPSRKLRMPVCPLASSSSVHLRLSLPVCMTGFDARRVCQKLGAIAISVSHAPCLSLCPSVFFCLSVSVGSSLSACLLFVFV